jgi:hypothetical protein
VGLRQVIPLPNRLFAWQPKRNTVRWDSAPFDDDGEDLILFDGSDRDPDLPVNLETPRRGKITDFLYSPLLLLFVSNRARALIQQYRTDGVVAHPLILRNREGAVVDDSYWWLNCRYLADIMNDEDSGVTYAEHDGIRRVEHFAVNHDALPAADLFVCRRPTIRVFREPLVNAIKSSGMTGCAFELLEGLRWPV